MRPAMLVSAAAVLAACSNVIIDDFPPLTPAQVQGIYRICTLRFTPVQTALPAVDLLATVVDPNPTPPAQGASLTLSGVAPQFDLVYTHRPDGALRQVRGDVEYGQGAVFLFLTSQSPTIIQQEALLPPGHLDLMFNPAAHTLTAGAEVSSYYVRRSDYTRAAAISEEGLQDRIWGHLTASFSAGACT